MDTLLTFPNPDVAYPVTKELDRDRLFGACGSIHDKLQELQHEAGFDYPGFEIYFTGTSGTAIATALAAMNRAKPTPMDLAFSHVAKNTDPGAHHRFIAETTHARRDKEGFAWVFLDDFTASGETFNRTESRVQRASNDPWMGVRADFDGFDGAVVLSGEVREYIRDRVNFVIRPDDY